MKLRLYFIQEGEDGPIKIGVTANPGQRLARLQIGNPTELHLLETYEADPKVERYLHRRLARHHIRGEWFWPHRDVYDAIEECDDAFVVARLLRGDYMNEIEALDGVA